MKTILNTCIFAVALLLAGCDQNSNSPNVPIASPSNTPSVKIEPGDLPASDAAIRETIVGTWKPETDSDAADEVDKVTINPDGTVSILMKPEDPDSKGETNIAAWRAGGGFFVVTMTNDDGTLDVESNQLVRLNEHDWFFLEDSAADVTKLHRQ